MNHDHRMKNTEIAFILDRSGSMQFMTNAAITPKEAGNLVRHVTGWPETPKP